MEQQEELVVQAIMVLLVELVVQEITELLVIQAMLVEQVEQVDLHLQFQQFLVLSQL